MLIKICGMKYASNIEDVVKLKPHMLGFIFYKHSLRYVGEDFDYDLIDRIPGEISRVAVFVNESLDTLDEITAHCGFEYVQLHGDESPEYCRILEQQGLKVIKAFAVDSHFDFEQILPYAPHCRYFLFDTKGEKRGGNGIVFDWTMLERYNSSIPFILSGGLGVVNVRKANSLPYPQLAGLDINSSIEIHPGLKSVEKIHQIIQIINNKS